MKKRKKILLKILLIFCIVAIFILIILFNRIKNPRLVEIQQLIDEAGIQDLQIQMDYGNNVLTEIAFEGSEEFYRSDRVFCEVDKVQKIVTSYIGNHPDAFIMDYQKDSAGMLYSGLEITFENSARTKYSSERKIFRFWQVEDKLQETSKGMNHLSIKGGYWYKISQLALMPDVKEFECEEMELDNENVINELPNTKRIKLYGILGGDQRSFIKKAKKKGIIVESDDLPEGDGETNYDEINSNLKKIQGD